MELIQEYSLLAHNSFNVDATCPAIYMLTTIADFELLPDLAEQTFYILGEGSNTLFVNDAAPVIIKPDLMGISIDESSDGFTVNVQSGENWHELVKTCLAKGIYGLENLALIPGSVGAAPVQNIGAYGVELSDFCQQVSWFEFSTQTVKKISKQECQFSYRNSTFKQALYNKGIITEVEFYFPKKWCANLSYAGLNELEDNATATQVMDKVISLRQAKLPDPELLPNAGSFFKNPIVNEAKANKIKADYPTAPMYKQCNGKVKLAAGWLIEKAGLKGVRMHGVGVHEHQALVLVNYESKHGEDLIKLAKYVQQVVLAKFDVIINPEVRMISAQGEQDFAKVITFQEHQ